MDSRSYLAEHERMTLAVELVRRGLRTIAIQKETGLTERAAQALQREIHGKPAKRGPLPTSRAILRGVSAQLHASVLLGMLRRLDAPDLTPAVPPRSAGLARIRQVVRAYDAYRFGIGAAPGDHTLTITDAWVLSRDLAAGLLDWRSCRRCRTLFVVALDGMPRRGARCPMCRLEAKTASVEKVGKHADGSVSVQE